MARGTLEVTATLDPMQFWPTSLLVKVKPGAFRFRASPSAAFETTRRLEGASVQGRVKRAIVDAHDRVVVRLQGIDAPELHYRPAAALVATKRTAKQAALFRTWDAEYRQHLGETATVEFAHELGAGDAPLEAVVTTRVDDPRDAFDTYGRLVGDIEVRVGKKRVNMNRWLAESGWALPGFYVSMSSEEIGAITKLADAAAKAKRGVWRKLSRKAPSFEWMKYRGAGATIDGKADIGPVIVPKVFRRLCAWAVNGRAKMLTGSFHDHLRSHPDRCYLTSEFLEKGSAAAVRRLDEFVGEDGSVRVAPGALVFAEATAVVVAD